MLYCLVTPARAVQEGVEMVAAKVGKEDGAWRTPVEMWRILAGHSDSLSRSVVSKSFVSLYNTHWLYP